MRQPDGGIGKRIDYLGMAKNILELNEWEVEYGWIAIKNGNAVFRWKLY